MFRSKKDVDRHVQDIFRKLKNDNEKPYRCYSIAKLYYQVGDYESAKRYVSSYLEIREESASAHMLLGQILEALGEKEAAINQYKISLGLDGSQNNLVLKVCELLADMDTDTDVNRIRYWVKRAEKPYPHHPVIFKLKEKMLTAERPNDNSEDLEALIASELSIKPTDVELRVKLIKYYITKQRLEDAYNHAANVESTYCHRNSIVWYQSLVELLGKFKKNKLDDWSFWVFYISTLERYAALSLKENSNEITKTIPEAMQAVFNFDQALNEFKSRNMSSYSIYTEEMLTHMWGQLHFHLACLLLRKTKREQGSWDETSRLCSVLFLFALHVHPMDMTASWTVHGKEQFKNLIPVWGREGSYRCSQAGNVLQDCARNNVKKLMNKIDTFFYTEAWRERIYQRIFVSKLYQNLIRTSHFCNHTVCNPPLHLCLPNELKRYDEDSEEVWPDSLHHHVWLGIRNRLQNISKNDQTYPQQYSHVFSDLQFSVNNLNQPTPDTLCKLDIDAFLNAAVLCAAVMVEDQQQRGFITRERLPTLPADLTSSLCTYAQEKWWSYAYKMYSRKETLEGDLGEIRQALRQGLETIRCIGNHGLHPVILVHLARLFHHRVKILKEKDQEHPDIAALEIRSELYWSAVIPLLERLQNNQTIRVTNTKLFNYEGKNMSNVELTNALEEGRLLLAQRFVRNKQYEEAIDALQILKCPEATFQQGQIYKMLADEIVGSKPRESLTSEMRSQHIIMLSKARNCYYLTLDRLRSPGMNLKQPLDSELCLHISAIENELKRIDPDISRGDLSRNECDVLSNESYSPEHSGIDQPITTVPISTLTGLGTPVNILSTPQKNTHRTPKQSSTPCRAQNQDIIDLSRNRTEARPSPERLDAQIRQMIHAKDTVMQTIIEQNKTIIEKIDELTKEMAELRKDSQKQQQQQQQQPPRIQPTNFNSNIEDDLYVLGEEDYGDINYTTNQSAQASTISGNIFPPSHRHPYSPLVYPPATAFQGYYQGTIPFTDPNAQAIPPLYPPSVYPMPVLYPNRPKVPDMLQQGLFAASRLATQLNDLITPQTNVPLQIPMQKVEVTKPQSIVKDTSNKKLPPVNVVITTSDTLPTTVPLVQPTLSVTIPAQYRMGNTSTVTTTIETQNVPHCYQISMPSQATIPTTVNLPPLSTTLTSTPANISLSETSKSNNIEIRSSDSPNSSAELMHESEHDPIPDFVPVIPLPAEVKVKTGEEDETTLYCARAKLFRFVDKEWKERGIGNVKLLRNAEGKVRLLMRREQVLKICANHMLRPDMELTSMPNTNRAWIWVANDFADEEVKVERLCIRFKTTEEALSFKQHFDDARASLSSINEKVINENDNKSITTTVKVSEEENNLSSSTITNNVPLDKEKPATTAAAIVGGFSFTSKPIIQTVSTEIENASQKQNETPKVSPFIGFSFNKPDFNKTPEIAVSSVASKNVSTPVTTQATIFSFLKANPISSTYSEPTTTSVSIGVRDVTTVTASQTAAIVSTTSASRVSLRRPHAPALAPAILNITSTTSGITQKSVLPGQEEGETKVLFEQKANLQRQYKDNKNWENKGAGQMKIILNIKTGNLNLLMHREEDSQVIYNQQILPEMKFKIKPINKNLITWIVFDATGENKLESYSLIFKSPEHASKFYDIITNDQQKQKTSETSNGNNNVNAENKQVPLAELFKPSPGSWECNACYTRNDGKQSKCLACGESSPLATTNAPTGTVESTAYTQQVPLSQLFKKPSGSWECKACYITNLETHNYCVACDSPKDPSMPPKPKTSGFNVGSISSESISTFTFGIPQESVKDTSGGFTFRLNKSLETDKDESVNKVQPNVGIKTSTDMKSIFGGTSQPPSTQPSQGTTQFVFGSPGKSFGFNFTAKSPVKSPGGGETSDEEVVESDDIHFSPIIPMPDEIEVKTGEEDEEILYSHRAKLFRYDSAAKEWKERGLGDIKLLRHHQTKKLRLIMRRDQVLKLCLNHCLLPEVEFKPKDEKTWLWNAADYSEGEIEYMQFACRFKTSEIAADFKRAIDNARESDNLSPNNEIIQEELVQQQRAKPSQDIQVVYEFKVTPEEKAAALKLQLPENFYAYKQMEDCPGCIGCKDLTPPIEDSQSQGELKTKGTLSSTISTPKTYSIPMNLNSHISEIKTSDNGNEKDQINASPRISFMTKSDNTDAISNTATIKQNTITTSNIFSAASLSFGENKSTVFNDKKSTGFIFGAPSSQSTINDKLIMSESIGQPNKPTEDPNNTLTKWFGNSNVKICEPVGANQQSSSFPSSHGKILNTPQFTLPASTTITPTFENTKNQVFESISKPVDTGLTNSFLNTTGSSSSLTFTNTFSNLPATTGTTTSAAIFSTTPSIIANPPTLKTSVFGTTTPFSSNITFGSTDTTLAEDTSKKEDDAPTFFMHSNLTFSALAQKSQPTEAFKQDPTFSFAGTGSSVFGSRTTSTKTESKQNQLDANKKDDNDEDEGNENENDQEHDPHFEPIIPLPDAIEVRTGEEDEIKKFCNRAKLYRYDNATKEWKERGVGEMKILYHAEYGTYRLLLRREQVYKVVCNFLITQDTEFRPLSTSNRAWIWAGMNHAEEPPTVEELAVKFKTPELAVKFKEIIDSIQETLRERQNEQDIKYNSEIVQEDKEECVEEFDDKIDDQEDIDEDDEGSILFEKRATLYTKSNNTIGLFEPAWVQIALGTLAVYYDSNIFGEKIILRADETGECLSNTIITMTTEMELNEKTCIWTAIDHALEPPASRILKAVFSSVQAAEQMHKIYIYGLECAKQAGISEQIEEK
ncbi:PREDICTED: E3 SUMO-protein ligase RanBP2-like [Polistes canadensis]|uniref:E3 SUMO-protein ligase RanBP2-like n=1 Tax=Polistes canadensis TaxID=91411 RepID=UPI000718C078|nr:PREDICTED: E3 SUMO-protein ligase RanBP2-like [Polistes canadensis]